MDCAGARFQKQEFGARRSFFKENSVYKEMWTRVSAGLHGIP